MAASGFTPISLYYSTTTSAVPVNTNLVNGELAINITDGKLFYKDNTGTVKLLASNATSTPVTSISFGSTGLTPSTSTTGAVTVAGTLSASNGGTGITGLGTGIATWLGTPSSANLASALTDETGSGLAVFNNAPALTTPVVTNYTETLYAPAAGSAFTVSLANGTVQQLSLNANGTITLPSSVAGKSFVIIVTYSGAFTLTWAGGSTIKWPGGTVPTASSASGKFDIFTFFQDGTNTYGNSFGLNY